MGKIQILKVASALSAMMFPVFARAEEGIFTPPDGDLFMAMLAQIIGKLLKASGWESDGTGVFAGVTGDPLHTTLELISTVGVGFALSLVAFSMLSTLIHSSQTGKTFIQDLGGAFYVGRTVTILFLLVPFWNGLGLGMILLTWAFSRMVGFGGTEWKSFLGIQEMFIKDSESNGNIRSLYAIKMPNPELHELVYRVFEGYVCMYAAASEQLYENERIVHNRGFAQDQFKEETSLNEKNSTIDDQGMAKVTIERKNDGKSDNTLGDTQDTVVNAQEASAAAQNGLEKKSTDNLQNSNKLAKEELEKYKKARKEVISQEIKDSYPEALVFDGKSRKSPNLDSIKKANTLEKAYVDFTKSPSSGAKPSSIKTTGILSFGNREQTACGVINFTTNNTFVENGYVQYANAGDIVGGIKEYYSSGEDGSNTGGKSNKNRNNTKGDIFIGASEELLNRSEKRRKDGVHSLGLDSKDGKSSSADQVLAIYADLFDKTYTNKIKDVAKKYVEAVNTHSRVGWKIRDGRIFPIVETPTDKKSNNNNGKEGNSDEEMLTRNKKILQIEAAYKLDVIADDIEKKVIEEIRKKIEQNSSKSNSSSLNDRNNYIDVLQLAQDSAEKQGFFSMFKFMTALQNNIANVQNLARIVPDFPDSVKDSKDFKAFKRLMPSSGYRNAPSKNLLDILGNKYGFMEDFAKSSQSKSLAAKYSGLQASKANPLMELAYGADVRTISSSYRHPMVMTVEAGHTMLNAIELYTNNKDKISSGKGDRRDVTSAGNAVNILVSSMYAMGMMLAYFIPALPLLYGIGAVLGITVNFLTILFSLPFVLAMHLTPEGSKYAGKAAQAYPQIISMLLAVPSLAFGFILAMVLMQVFGILAISAFADGMDLIYSSNYSPVSSVPNGHNGGYFHLNSLTASFAVFLLFTYLLYQLNIRSLSIMTLAADKIPTMIGGAMGQLTEAAQSIGGSVIENKIESKASAIGQGAASYAPSSSNGPVGGSAAPVTASVASSSRPSGGSDGGKVPINGGEPINTGRLNQQGRNETLSPTTNTSADMGGSASTGSPTNTAGSVNTGGSVVLQPNTQVQAAAADAAANNVAASVQNSSHTVANAAGKVEAAAKEASKHTNDKKQHPS